MTMEVSRNCVKRSRTYKTFGLGDAHVVYYQHIDVEVDRLDDVWRSYPLWGTAHTPFQPSGPSPAISRIRSDVPVLGRELSPIIPKITWRSRHDLPGLGTCSPATPKQLISR